MVFFILLLPVLFGFMGFGVDFGLLYVSKGKLQDVADIEEESYAIRDTVLVKMAELRAVADEAETTTAKKYWPFPTYADLLFSI